MRLLDFVDCFVYDLRVCCFDCLLWVLVYILICLSLGYWFIFWLTGGFFSCLWLDFGGWMIFVRGVFMDLHALLFGVDC